jgi:L-phenylalanine/L-methionine N-acetyltransferase
VITSTVVRRVEMRDAAAIAALFAHEGMLPFTDAPPHSGQTYWEKRIAEYADAAHLPLVAITGNAASEVVVGLVLLQGFPNHIRRKHAAVLTLLAVHPAHRRAGVGRTLVDATINACDQWMNVRRIEVAIDAESTALKRYYASFGFVEEGVRVKDHVHAGRTVSSLIMSRINTKGMVAPASPPLVLSRRKKLAPIKISVRAATSDDADGFASVFATRGASSGTLQHPYTSAEIWRARLTSNVPATRQLMLVAIVNRRVVGNAGVHPVSDNPRRKHVCGIGISVMDAYQSRGVGRALMNACLDYADNWANYPRVELTVHADNLRAIKLYESLGFVTEGRHREFSFREGGYVDALFMGRVTKLLAEN